MFIIGRTGRTYARLTFNAGPGGSILLPVSVDWAAWPDVMLEEQARLPEMSKVSCRPDQNGVNQTGCGWPLGLRNRLARSTSVTASAPK